MKIAVSACLLGHNCKYNGKNNFSEKIAALALQHELIPICPEVMGGMSTPRIPCERAADKVLNQNGEDQSEFFYRGAEKALQKLLEKNVDLVILQPRSPSCGAGEIYDGTFGQKLKEGDGVFVELLKKHQIPYLNAQTI